MAICRTINTIGWLITVLPLVQGRLVALKGAGASFPYQVYEKSMSGFKHHRSNELHLLLTYDCVGSGSGMARIKGEKEPDVHFAGSDYPLTREELTNHPDLIQFPTMAGSVVMVYNIPNLNSLTLSMETIVGIYNGTFRKWDDPKIKELNPDMQLPEAEIIKLARSDRCGTTYAFTNCLSSYSDKWRKQYGTFSHGLDSKRRPTYWNETLMTFFGRTSNGMTGMVLSLENSIGYVSISDAIKSDIPFAYIQKSTGNVVKASVETVQKAITYANGSLDIGNTPGPDSYPLASFTFFITRRINPKDCEAMVEFVRFVEWSFNSDIPRKETEELSMVPLDFATVFTIKETLLKSITCKGSMVWDLYLQQQQDEHEEQQDRSWMIPTYGGIAVLLAVIVTLAILFGNQQYKLHKQVLNDTWKLNASKIIIDKNTVEEHKKVANTKSNLSRHENPSTGYVGRTLADQSWLEQYNVQGIYEDAVITLSETRVYKMSMKDKKMALLMRDTIKHANVMPFIGLAIHRVYYLGVYAGVSRGTILDVLSNPKYQIQTTGVIGFIKDLAEGMKYLHRKGIVHGNLKGTNCLVDMAWNLKITAWCENIILERTFLDTIHIDSTGRVTDESTARKLLWTAPEIIKFNRPPSQAGDVYSFGMVVQEMLTGEEPFEELDKKPCEIIDLVVTCSIKPAYSSSTPQYIQRLLDTTSEMDPYGRPSFINICSGLKSAFPKNTSILDSIIDSFEGYVEILEQRLKDTDDQKKRLKLKTKAYLQHMAPSCIIDKILDDGEIASQRLKGISAIVVIITNMDQIVDTMTNEAIFTNLKLFYAGLDKAFDTDDIYIVERHAEKTTYATGLPAFNRLHAQNACSIALQVKTFCEYFNRQHLNKGDASIKVNVGVAGSSALSGVLSTNIPRYTTIGTCFEEATRLAMASPVDSIWISKTSFEDVRYCSHLIITEIPHDEEVFYQLHEYIELDPIALEVENSIRTTLSII